MQVQLVGVKKVDYVSKKTNEKVLGTELHVLEHNDYVQGAAAEKYYISATSGIDTSKMELQEFYDLQFNRYGKLDGITAVK